MKHSHFSVAVLVACIWLGGRAFAQGTWTSEAPIPTPRFGAATGVINGQLYVAGGCCVTFGFPFTRFHTLEVYDPASNSWTTKAPMPHAVYGAAAGVINGKLYAAGGQADPTDGNLVPDLQIYDPATDTWTTGAPLPQPTAAANAGVINGKLYVVSGGVDGNSAVSTVLVYDPVANTWTTLSPTPNPRSFAGTAVINGILYVVGGLIPSGQFSSAAVGTVDAYNPATDTWTTLASMPTPRFTVAVGVINGILYAAGGQDNFNTFATVESYDPAKNTWTTAPSMLTAAYGPAAGVINNSLILAGGNTVQFQLVSATEAFTSFNCPVKPTDVQLHVDGLSLDMKPIFMFASFTPSTGQTLAELASDCGFTEFDWVQMIDHWPGPSGLFAETAPTVPIIIPPQLPINDPPLGGYTYLGSQQPPLLGAFPFYYNTGSVPSGCSLTINGVCSDRIIDNLGFTLNYFDSPRNGCLPGGSFLLHLLVCDGASSGPPFMSFKTQLVGVCGATPSPICSGPGKPSAPLFQWTWNDNFNGTSAGGVFEVQTASSSPADPSSGTGGVIITSVNGTSQTPPTVTCNATPNFLWPPNGKLVAVTVSGTVTAGTSQILPNGVSFSVIDTEGQTQPNGPVAVGSDGAYSFAVGLPASRAGNDKNGRTYTIGVVAGDAIGNQGSCVSVVTVPHDQGQ